MTTHALMELAERLEQLTVDEEMNGYVKDKIEAIATQLRTAASEGGEEPFAHLVMTEWNSIAWWTTESAERAQQEADELMRYDSMRKLTVVTVYTHPPEWCDCAVTAMQSFPKLPQSSSPRTSKAGSKS